MSKKKATFVDLPPLEETNLKQPAIYPSKYKSISNTTSIMDDIYDDSEDDDLLASVERQGLVSNHKNKKKPKSVHIQSSASSSSPDSNSNGNGNSNGNSNGNHRDNQEASKSTGMLLITWLIVLGMMALGVGGLLAWRRVEHTGHLWPVLNDEEDIYNPNAHVFNTQTSSQTTTSSSSSSAGKNREPLPLGGGGGGPEPRHNPYVHYDPEAVLHHSNPLDLPQMGNNKENVYGASLTPPRLFDDKQQPDQAPEEELLGYFQHPTMVNHTLIFCNQGDLFLTKLSSDSDSDLSSSRLSAFQLTTTVGNVLDPKLHPSGLLVAYTATYTGRRDVYILDLRGAKTPALRVTYWDTGVSGLVGWTKGGTALLFRANSNAVSLPDYRLYELSLVGGDITMAQEPQGTTAEKVSIPEIIPTALKITPIPLSQAIDGTPVNDDCLYFVRFSQSSQTIRYTGGTAESVWSYCEGNELALPLFDDEHEKDQYKGTTKSPQVYPLHEGDDDASQYLFLLSDRAYKNGKDASEGWIPGRMNIWALELSPSDVGQRVSSQDLIPITDTACDFQGRTLREYTIDPVTLHVIGRIGADLYRLTASTIQEKLLQANNRQRRHGRRHGRRRRLEDLVPNEAIPASGNSAELTRLPIIVHSDFQEGQERILPVDVFRDVTSGDIYETVTGSVHVLVTLRGQLWVAPVVDRDRPSFEGAGMNLPDRRYRLAPGAMMGGIVRIIQACHVPNPIEDDTSDRRLAVILATDPMSPTAEHAFYLIETQWDATPLFIDLDDLPKPFLGGHVSGNSTFDGGLGSIQPDSLKVSPCGRRMTWVDRDGRIPVMTLPHYRNLLEGEVPEFTVLPKENEIGGAMQGHESSFAWSPGGRYLAVEHNAANQFRVISIVDCGDPDGEDNKVADIKIGRIVQATPDRFNSQEMYWGKSAMDIHVQARDTAMASILGGSTPDDVATTLYFLTDRDIHTDVSSPWGSRQPMPHFKSEQTLYALPLTPRDPEKPPEGRFTGGGATELYVDELLERQSILEAVLESSGKGDEERRRLSKKFKPLAGAFGWAGSFLEEKKRGLAKEKKRMEVEEATEDSLPESKEGMIQPASFPKDMDINFGPEDLTFARKAYRLASIPQAGYLTIVSQTLDDGSLVLAKSVDGKLSLDLCVVGDFPSDKYECHSFETSSQSILDVGLSTSRQHFYVVLYPTGGIKVVTNTVLGVSSLLSDKVMQQNFADLEGMHLSIWPSLEYKQLYSDAWRMLRDYFYDTEMNGVDWPAVHERYFPLVSRCTKREELSDVLAQMASELSALHVFVYGGDTNDPMHGDYELDEANEIASLGAVLERAPEWKGYRVVSIPERDPDFNVINGGYPVYSPLSDQTLRLSGQQGLKAGDIIVGVNGESLMRVSDIHVSMPFQVLFYSYFQLIQFSSHISRCSSEEWLVKV
jgi:hypothetical protein